METLVGLDVSLGETSVGLNGSAVGRGDPRGV